MASIVRILRNDKNGNEFAKQTLIDHECTEESR